MNSSSIRLQETSLRSHLPPHETVYSLVWVCDQSCSEKRTVFSIKDVAHTRTKRDILLMVRFPVRALASCFWMSGTRTGDTLTAVTGLLQDERHKWQRQKVERKINP